MSKRIHHGGTESAEKAKRAAALCVKGKGPVILFRQIMGNKPCNWMDGMHWYVEYHAAHLDMPFPLGVAYVTVPPEQHRDITGGPFIDFILVADQWRREGIASALVEACRRRWPDLWLTDAISESGAAFLRSMNCSASPRLSGEGSAA